MSSLDQIILNVVATTTSQLTPSIDNYKNLCETVFIKNNSKLTPIQVQLVLSPDGLNWVEETVFHIVAPGKTIYLLQGVLGKFCAVNYQTTSGTASATIWIDVRRYSYNGKKPCICICNNNHHYLCPHSHPHYEHCEEDVYDDTGTRSDKQFENVIRKKLPFYDYHKHYSCNNNYPNKKDKKIFE